MLKIVDFDPKYHFSPFGVKNFLTKIFFSGHRSGMEAELYAKNQEKKLKGQGCRTETDARTDGRTDESEFIGSFGSLKTSGEPKNKRAMSWSLGVSQTQSSKKFTLKMNLSKNGNFL